MRRHQVNLNDMHWEISIHDQSQVELVLDYKIAADETSKRSPDFEIDFYFYLPKSLASDSSFFSADRLFRNLKNFIRIHTPDNQDLRNVNLLQTQKYLSLKRHFAAKEAHYRSVIKELKIFGNFINLNVKRCSRSSAEEQLKGFIKIYQLMKKFRTNFVGPLNQDHELIHEKVFKAINRVDEYCSNRFYQLGLELTDRGHLVSSILSEEGKYRSEAFESFAIDDDSIAREHFYQRYSNLKKFVSEGVYLKSKTKNMSKFYKNLFAAIAAGLAALFANLAQIEGGIATGANDFGFRFVFMLALAVGIYVFKDRIKDLSKDYFNRIMKSKLPDSETHLSFENSERDGVLKVYPAGKFQEFVKTISKKGIPEDVKYIRKIGLKNKIHSPVYKNVLSYKKKLWLQGKLATALQQGDISYKDIYRFNINDYLPFLDDPTKSISFLDDQERIKIVEAPKTYYIDMIMKVSNLKESPAKICLESIRLVLDKNGLVRLDHLTPKDKFRFTGVEVVA